MNYSNTQQGGTQPSALVAVFATRELAKRAISRLHDEGFHHTWLGITESMGYEGATGATGTATRVESDNAVARFFGAGDDTLHEALLKHGVSEADAAQLDNTLPAQSAIVTVNGENHPELAVQIVSECDGEMVTSKGSSPLYDTYAEDKSSRALPKDRLAGLGAYSKGEKLDEPRRIQLREERLTVDKRRESAGQATVGTRVVEQKTEMDVPVMHEELFIERRPSSATENIGTIGSGDKIVVPLERERVVVDKKTVATEDVLVGQRRVEGTERVSETLKKEELDVDTDVRSDKDGIGRRGNL